jgi:prepilin-type N-terminal cleavage/methylation domain-containing protein
MFQRRSSGFTIIELLVVIAVVGILGAASVYSLGVSRATSRDAKRVSDISVLQKAAYPIGGPADLGKPGAGADRLTDIGFIARDAQADLILLDRIPTPPMAGEYYRYRGTADGYSLRFRTERPTAYGPAGTWYAHSNVVDQEDIEK